MVRVPTSLSAWPCASAVGLLGAIAWLLTAKRPIVSLRVMGDRNFALGAFCTVMLFAIVYASAVLIPQLAQGVLNYNSTLARVGAVAGRPPWFAW